MGVGFRGWGRGSERGIACRYCSLGQVDREQLSRIVDDMKPSIKYKGRRQQIQKKHLRNKVEYILVPSNTMLVAPWTILTTRPSQTSKYTVAFHPFIILRTPAPFCWPKTLNPTTKPFSPDVYSSLDQSCKYRPNATVARMCKQDLVSTNQCEGPHLSSSCKSSDSHLISPPLLRPRKHIQST